MHPEDVTTPRRRSSRLSGPEENVVDKPVVATLVPPRKTFALKKIVPRKTQVAELNKENDERLSNVPEKRPRSSTPAAGKKTKVSTPSSGKKGKPSTPSSAKQAKVSITPSPEKRPKLSTPAQTKKSTPSSQKTSKASTTPSSVKTPKIPSPAPEKKSTPSSQKKAKVYTSATASSSGKKPTASTPWSGKEPKVSTPALVADTPVPRSTRTRTPTILSPILPPQDQENQTQAQSPPRSSRNRPTRSDETWSQKVRRSYSRLSGGDDSFSSPLQDHNHPQGSPVPLARRETLFGFEKMTTPKVMRAPSANVSASAVGASSTCGLTAVLNLSGEAEDSLSGEPVPDPNIPGVAIHKKQARKKKVQPITVSELDSLAALMNAEFAEAESFELFVE